VNQVIALTATLSDLLASSAFGFLELSKGAADNSLFKNTAQRSTPSMLKVARNVQDEASPTEKAANPSEFKAWTVDHNGDTNAG
jgi:hypothetical protein